MTSIRCYCGLGLAVALTAAIAPTIGAGPPVRIAPPSSASPPVAIPYVIAPYESPIEPAPPVADTGVEDCQRAAGSSSRTLRPPTVSHPAETDPLCPGCNVHPEPAFGTSYNAIMRAQIAKGEAALMVLYHYDFVPGEATLTYRGRLRLQKIARLAPQNPFPIIIEANRYDQSLDAARQAQVVAELAWATFPVPAERVIVGLSPERGLDGLDAELVHQNLLNLSNVGGSAGQTATPGSGMGTPVPAP